MEEGQDRVGQQASERSDTRSPAVRGVPGQESRVTARRRGPMAGTRRAEGRGGGRTGNFPA